MTIRPRYLLPIAFLICTFGLSAQFRAPLPDHPGGVTAATCPSSGVIPGFEIDVANYQSYTLSWDPPANVAEPTYDVYFTYSTGYCDLVLNQNLEAMLAGSTTSTTFTVQFPSDNMAYRTWVVVRECPNIQTEFAWVLDTFRNIPAAPGLELNSLVGRQVSLGYRAADAMSYVLRMFRESPSGQSQYQDIPAETWCPVGSTHIFTDNLTDLPDGTWRYAVASFNAAGYLFSPAVSVTLGASNAPEIRSFDALPARIRAGQSTTLVWSTEGANSVSISPGSSSLPANGTTVVTPSQTTTYTLTAFGSSGSVTETTTVEVIATPEVVITNYPEPMVQGTGSGGATTSFVCINVGGSPASVQLTPIGNFFSISTGGGTLGPGDVVTVQITGEQRDTGSYEGEILLSGDGFPPGTSLPVRLLAVPTPDGPTAAEAEVNRIDVVGRVGQNPTGTATFRNTGQARIQGTLVSSEPWLIPQPGLIEVDPGETVVVSFAIDRSKRPSDAPLGSLEGKLQFVFRTGSSGKQAPVDPRDGVATTTSLVTVVDTSTPQVAAGDIPPLGAQEVALFLPGVGHVQGSQGLFFSDLSLINLSGSKTIDNLNLYFTPSGTTNTVVAQVSNLAAGTPVPLADIAKSVFNVEQIGSLQIRTSTPDLVAVNASTLLQRRSDQKTLGATIPLLRSDQSVPPGQSLFLTGLKATPTSHTNIFLQETSGGVVTVDLEFFNESGNSLGSRTETVGPFDLKGLFDSQAARIFPLGAVSAVLTSRPDSTGAFSAYATPVDDASGDFWSLVDWNAQFGFSGDQAMLIPVAGALQGATGYFRTDLAVINRGDTPASGVLRYITRPEEARAPIEKTISLGARQSSILENITFNLFDIPPSEFTLGFIEFIPQSGAMTVTSRNFATVGEDPGSFGTGVPTLPLASSMQLGDVTRIGGLKDSSFESFANRLPGTFRSNFGIMETTGEGSVTVRVTLHFTFSTGTTAVARGTASKDFTVGPHGYLQRGRISAEILGESRDDYGDFSNLQADFAVVDGSGAATVWVSSVENDTTDSALRVK